MFIKYTTFKKEKIIKDYGLWLLIKAKTNYYNGNERSLYIILNKETGYMDYIIIYDDRSIGYDNPFRIPQYIRSDVEHYIYNNYVEIKELVI